MTSNGMIGTGLNLGDIGAWTFSTFFILHPLDVWWKNETWPYPPWLNRDLIADWLRSIRSMRISEFKICFCEALKLTNRKFKRFRTQAQSQSAPLVQTSLIGFMMKQEKHEVFEKISLTIRFFLWDIQIPRKNSF